MQRLICLTIGMSMAATAAPPRKPATTAVNVKSPPIFSFMGQDTETPTTMVDLGGEACQKNGAELECSNFRNATIAGRPMRYLDMRYNAGKLYMVIGAFGDAAYSAVRDAFIAKYGTPDEVVVRKWQSKAGGVFDNLVSIWRFKGGDLQLNSMGSKVGSGDFAFESMANSPPKAAPKVDF